MILLGCISPNRCCFLATHKYTPSLPCARRNQEAPSKSLALRSRLPLAWERVPLGSDTGWANRQSSDPEGQGEGRGLTASTSRYFTTLYLRCVTAGVAMTRVLSSLICLSPILANRGRPAPSRTLAT